MPELFLLLALAALMANLFFISLAVYDLMQRSQPRYLSKTLWLLIIAFVFFGGALYLLIGRKK